MAVRRDQVQLNISIITDESKQYAKLIEDNKTFMQDLRRAKKNGEDLTKTVNDIAAAGQKVGKIDLNKVAPTQLVARARQLSQVLSAIPQSAPQYRQLEAELKDINDELATMRQRSRGVAAGMDDIGKEGSRLSAIFKGAFAALSVDRILDGIINVGRQAIETSAKFEKLEAVLVNTLGSESKAQEALQLIADYAARTPFQVDEITDAYIRLTNRGLQPTRDELTLLGDLAASQGKDFLQLTEAILDATTGEFERLKEFGIKGSKELDRVTLSFKDQRIEVENNAEAIKSALLNFGALEGVAGSTAAVSETLAGQLSNLRDNLDRLLARFGDSVLGIIFKRAVGSLNDFLSVTDKASDGVRDLQTQFNIEIETLQKGNLSVDNRRKLIDQINNKYQDYLPNLITEKDTIDDIRIAQEGANAAFNQRITLLAAEEALRDVTQKRLEAKRQELDIALRQTKAEKDLQDARVGSVERASNSRQGIDTRLSDAQQRLQRIRNEAARNQETQQELQTEFDKTIQAATELGLNINEVLYPSKTTTSGGSGNGTKSTVDEFKELDDIINKLLASNEQLQKATDAANAKVEKENSDLTTQFLGENEADAKYLEDQKSFREKLAELNLTEDEKEIKQINEKYDKLVAEAQYYKTGVEELEKARADELAKVNERILKNKQQTADDEVEIERKKQAAIARLQQEAFNVASDFLQLGIDLLSKDEAAKKKNFEKIKRLEKGQVYINLAAEVAAIWKNASSNPTNAIFPGFAEVLATAQTAAAVIRANLQLSNIDAQKYAVGGYTGGGYGRPDSTGFKPAGVVHEGEYVGPKWMVEKYPQVFQALEGIRLRGYADGGLAQINTTPVVNNFSSITNASNVDTEALASEIRLLRQDVRNQQRQMKAYVVYQELETAATDLNDTRQAASI